MKIIGGHDYYDGAGYGVDETVLFLRREEEIEDTPFDLPKPYMRNRFHDPYLAFHLVLAGGRVFPAVEEHIPGHDSRERNVHGVPVWIPDRSEWHYTREAALAAHDRIKKDDEARRWKVLSRYRRDPIDDIETHFRKTEDKAWTDWMIENRVITGHVHRCTNRGQTVARINIATLKDLDFYKALDPASTHMQIAGFISGVLPSSPDTVELNDRDRIRKAGFNERSFRQDPGIKKPRRRGRKKTGCS